MKTSIPAEITYELGDEANGKRQFNLRRFFKRAVTSLFVAMLAAGGFLGWKLYTDASKVLGNKNPLALLASFTPTDLKTDSNGRVNILLAGYSADDSGHAGAELTDSIMIVSIDPTNKNAVVISVPRDLYVNIPGYGYAKINEAYQDGGMSLLEAMVTQSFGVDFGYYALINYTAFKDTVDAVGGVTTTITSSDTDGLYDPNTNLDLQNGAVTLSGEQALSLARARGEGYGSYGFTSGDFDRTAHQQQLLVALKDKISSASVISNPLKIGKLADAIGNNVKTDMKIGEMETLYIKVKDISDANIKTVTLDDYNDTNYLSYYTTRSGQSALIPAAGIDDFSDIQSLVKSLLVPTTASTD